MRKNSILRYFQVRELHWKDKKVFYQLKGKDCESLVKKDLL